MRIERTYDMNLIAMIMTHPAVYPHISDDYSPPVDDFEPIEGENILYLLVLDDNDYTVGLYLVHAHNGILYEIHTCLLPTCRGKQADQAAKAVLEWVFTETACQKLMTWVPENNPPALAYAKRAGLQEEGVNTKSFLKNGVLYDQTLLGIRRTTSCQQLQ